MFFEKKGNQAMPTKFFFAAADFLKKNVVLAVAFVLAVTTMFFVPPDAGYASYFDGKTLACLFCTLAVVGALRDVNFFSYLARRIVCLTGTLRAAVIAVVCITFLGSMLLANDMALITFLPLGYYVLSCTDHREILAFVFILQNIAANLGGMLTPFGNPQNLYLYEYFRIENSEFFRIMLPSFLVAVCLILLCCMVFVKNERLRPLMLEGPVPPKKRTSLYLLLFVFSILLVFRIVPYTIGLVLIAGILLTVDRKALAEVDYPLLLTFVCFFVFSGNLARVDAVNRILSGILAKNTLLVSVLSCQFISNVPSAVLLSHFTTDYPNLLLGVNIGGTGTLIASLASMITFREYGKDAPGQAKRYLLLFSAFNFFFLGVLVVWNLLV